MRLTLSDFVRQLTTLRATGTRSRLEALDTLWKFGRMFIGSLGAEFFEPSRTRLDARPGLEAMPIR